MTLVDSVLRALRSPAFKFLIILALVLALTIPLLMVYAVVKEREGYARRAAREIGQLWGGPQSVAGPFLVVPTEKDVRTSVPVQGAPLGTFKTQVRTERRFAVFLPETLKIAPVIASETRRRGIFEVPVYRGRIAISGAFVAPDLRGLSKSVDRFVWSEAVLVTLMSDVRGIRETATLKIGDRAPVKFKAGVGLAGLSTYGIHVPLQQDDAKSGFSFAFTVALNGSSHLHFTPSGGDTSVEMRSDWPHPSFEGAFLPVKRTIKADGFTATWQVPRLARGRGQVRHVDELRQLAREMPFGVRLFQPVKFYSLAERALKYALGFVAIVFLTVFVMEVHARRRVHWIQYLFVGLALVVFYVLLVGTAEHIGFERGYLSAALATSLLIAVYSGLSLRSAVRGVLMWLVLAGIYGLIYLLLRLEDYALLVGSIGAFVLLAVVMFATRGINWSGDEPTALETDGERRA